MNERTIAFIAGLVTGGGVVAAIGYFGIYRQYVPLNRIQDTVNDLEQDRLAKGRQLDAMDKAYVERKKEYDDRIIELQTQLDVFEADAEEARLEKQDKATVREPSGQGSSAYVDLAPAQEEAVSEEFVIHDGNPRWDGALTPQEQADILACNGDENLIQGELLRIKEERYDRTSNPDEITYLISAQQHADAPEFFDAESLDYYEGDDVLARGREIVPSVEDLIDPLVLNHFGKLSQSGDPDTVWCRNERYKTDYEIMHHDGSWQAEVYNMNEDEIYVPESRREQHRGKK